MWVVRELLRLFSRIGIAVLIAIVVAELRALIGGGDVAHTFQIMLLVLGCFMLLLATAGTKINQQKADRWANAHVVFVPHSLGLPEALAGAGGPTLSASAVFAGSGIVLLALGLFL